MKFTWSYDSTKIDQSTYARDVVKAFERLVSSKLDKIYTMPMDRDIKITKADLEEIPEKQAHFAAKYPYQNAINALLYLSNSTRLDLP